MTLITHSTLLLICIYIYIFHDLVTTNTCQPKNNKRQLMPWVIEPKTPEEIEKMRAAGRVAREVLDIAGRAVRVGITTDEIDQLVHEETLQVSPHLDVLFLLYGRVYLFGCVCRMFESIHPCILKLHTTHTHIFLIPPFFFSLLGHVKERCVPISTQLPRFSQILLHIGQ